MDEEAAIHRLLDGGYGFFGLGSHPVWTGFVEDVVKHREESIEMEATPILSHHFAGEGWARKNRGCDLLAIAVSGGDEIVIDQVDDHVKAKLEPGTLERWVLDFSAQFDGINTEFLLELLTLVGAVAIVIGRVHLILHNFVFRPRSEER